MNDTARRLALAALASGFALAIALPAASELFRCRDASGKVVFTDQKSLCPNEEPFEPKGVVHPVDPSPVAPPAERAPTQAPPSPDIEDAQIAHWQQKKRDAEEAIEKIEKRRAWMKKYVGHCNRGGYVTTRDEAGIKQVVNCSKLRRDYDALEESVERARAYLKDGLREECRRAGCLPGWIR